jgi:hypothetical protein
MSTPTRRNLPRGAYRVEEDPATTATPASPLLLAAPQRHTPAPAPSRPSTGALGRTRRGLALRPRLIAALIGVALLPLAATALGGIQLARTSLLRQSQQVLSSSADATATKIDAYLAGVRSSLVSSRQQVVELIAAGSSPSANCPAAVTDIEAVLRSDSAANGIQATGSVEYLDKTGIVRASSQCGEEGEDLSASVAVKAALGQTLTSACQATPTTCAIVAGPAFDPTASSDLRETLEVVAPMYAANAGPGAQPTGVLRARFSMRDKIVSWVLADSQGQGGGLLIERDSGLILADSIPPGTLTFASLVPFSAAAVQTLKASNRYSGQPTVRPIPGLNLEQLRANCAEGQLAFVAGIIGGSNTSNMLYACAPLVDSPSATPWVYLLGKPVAELTAPADNILDVSGFPALSLAQTALMVGLVALFLGLACGLITARWTSSWLTTSVEQLGATASAFLGFARDQRQAAEEQRHRLTAARTALHDIHRTAGALSEAIERAVNYAEDGPQGTRDQRLSGPTGARASSAAVQAQPGASNSAWWSQWALAMRDRLSRQYHVSSALADEARVTAEAAHNMRQRGTAVAMQAAAIEATLWHGGIAVAEAGRAAPPNWMTAGVNGPARMRGARSTASSGLHTGTLRLVLLGLLLAIGLLPSLGFVAKTNAQLRANLAGQNNQVLFGEGESRAQAVDALVQQQQLQVTGLDTIFRSLGSGLSADVASHGLAAAVAATTPDFGTSLLELADPHGRVLAASTANAVGTDVSGLPFFASAQDTRVPITSAVYYDPTAHAGWYYIAAPMRSSDQRSVIGVAIGAFGLGPIWRLVVPDAHDSSAQGSTFTLVIEPSDSVVLADSRQAAGTFGTAAPLGQSALDRLWREGRYPQGKTPPMRNLPEVVAAIRAAMSSSSPAGSAPFTGSSGTGAPLSEYRLIPLNNAPWDLVEAQSITAATTVADQLTRYDLLLSLIIVVLTATLAFLLGQSIIVPVRRLRDRFRQAAHRLVAITRRQDEAAQRQEAALPPVDATAQLLALETEEVAQVLLSHTSTLPQVTYAPPPALPPGPSGIWPSPTGSGSSGGPAPSFGAPWGAPSTGAGPMPAPIGASALAPDQPTMEALRHARIVANDWSLRQQRILADLASALNATDELSRASVEGQHEATELANLAVDLLESAR